MRRRALLSQSGKKLFVIDIDKYMTMEALSGGLKAKLTVSACQYCVDGDGDWKDLPANTFTEFVEEGHFLSFKATGLKPSSLNGIGTFVTADDVAYQFNLRGNCMAMLYGDEAEDYVSIPNYGFYKLFQSNKGLQSVSEKFIGATGVGNSGCRSMFNACTSLVNSPVLPSRLNGAYCFYQMYYSCKSLTDAPELPATSLQVYCYAYMFYGCKALKNAPALPATTLSTDCYSFMFSNCTGLTTAPVLPATTMKADCYYRMFAGCSNLTSTPSLPSTTLANGCYSYMFYGCSKITSITLPATTLITECYHRMLYNCSSLNYITALFTTIPGESNALYQWVYGVAKTGTFVKAADATWDVTGTSGVPSGWTIQTATA